MEELFWILEQGIVKLVDIFLAKPYLFYTESDLHNMDGDSQAFLVGALLTQLQDHVKTRTPTEKPFVVCIEEAHLFAPEIYEARSSREAIVQCPVARMLKEIRKFNVGVILIDQRPSQVTSDAIANCNTLIAFRLLEDHDKQKVIRSLGFNPGGGEARPRRLLAEEADS